MTREEHYLKCEESYKKLRKSSSQMVICMLMVVASTIYLGLITIHLLPYFSMSLVTFAMLVRDVFLMRKDYLLICKVRKVRELEKEENEQN